MSESYITEFFTCMWQDGLCVKLRSDFGTNGTYLINSEVLSHQCLSIFVSHKSNMILCRQNFIPDGKVRGLAQWDGLGIRRTFQFLFSLRFFFLQQNNKNRKENPVKISRMMNQPRARYLIWTVHTCVRSENRKCKLYWEMLPALWKKKKKTDPLKNPKRIFFQVYVIFKAFAVVFRTWFRIRRL